MGNKCSSSCSNSSYLSCIHCKKESKKVNLAADVLPENLHANSGQKFVKETVNSSFPLELSNTPETQVESNAKFPAFPLHGIQKSSPTHTSSNEDPTEEDCSNDVAAAKVEKLFEYYKDKLSDEDAVLAEGVERFCLDLEVDPTEFIVLALAWKFKAETMCKFTRKEFTEGFLGLKCDSINRLKSAFKQIEADAMDNFKDLYRYTFQFALEAEQGQRSLPCQIAIAMWNVVFSINPPFLLESWLAFLQQNNVRGISRDTWNMFLYLTESLDEDLSNYNDNEAWPSLFDDFVDYEKENRNKQQKMNANESDDIDSTEPSDNVIHKNETPQNKSTSLESNEVIGDNVSKSPKLNIPGAIGSSSEEICKEARGENRTEDVEFKKSDDVSNETSKPTESTNDDLLSQLHADTPSTANI